MEHLTADAFERFVQASGEAQLMLLKLQSRVVFLQGFVEDALRYRWLRDGNGYLPEEHGITGGEALDALCDVRRARGPNE